MNAVLREAIETGTAQLVAGPMALAADGISEAYYRAVLAKIAAFVNRGKL